MRAFQGGRPLAHQPLTRDTTEAGVRLLQTDPATLNRLVTELDAALKSIRTTHYRRITRAIK